ncbi:hypothetical protein NQ317_012272 [Molorchus minor]|uniref:SMC hinge domain-containing protein n=1 Tax=Molorchus minor TaxID=1323400 RepID=A0ABQ9K2S9_9CUCU|nr:hypothetical protein NQ317_012272 [Molorchus minor]
MLEANLKNLNFSEEHMGSLMEKKRMLHNEIRLLKDKVENFEARRPYTKFRYSDPEPNFNKRGIKGVMCRLLKCLNNNDCLALETAAGGRLYNVVVDTEVTSKKLLQKGNLQLRTTFIPLNKIKANKMDNNTIRLAQELVGKENCRPALSLIQYDKELQNAMEFIFGNVFICKDINVAKQVTFHERIRRKCVTLDGDMTDPSGTLSGGAPQKGGSILQQLAEIQQYEEQLAIKENELAKIEAEVYQMGRVQEQYNSLKQRYDLCYHELNLIGQRMQQTTHHRQQEEINNLKTEIDELREKVKVCREMENKSNQKAKDLEIKMKDAKGYRERQLKEAEADMKSLKQKADKSRKEWKQREQDYATLNLEIAELKQGLENTQQQIQICEENLVKLNQQYEEMSVGVDELREEVKSLQGESAIAEKNKEVQKKIQKKEDLLAKNNDLQLKIKELAHEIKKLEDKCKHSKTREQEYAKKIKPDNVYLEKAEQLSHKEGLDLERRIKIAQEKKQKLGRTVNAKAQSMFEQEEKQFNELRKKQKLLTTMTDLDQKKKNSLKLAYEQISKDFGSIFSTLLPGANAKLVPPAGKTILEGLEVKVSLGGVWKESLTELSGGQRSLAALSLILAMLLFKPAPLYILDEVDAALDLSHTQNIGNMLKTHFKKSQFIIVSLKDGMFNNANVLFRTKFIDGVSAVTRTVNKAR